MGEAVLFVGRARELPRLRAALGGDARLLLVVGDAGVGKTRFVAEGLRLAAGDGLVAVSGGADWGRLIGGSRWSPGAG